MDDFYDELLAHGSQSPLGVNSCGDRRGHGVQESTSMPLRRDGDREEELLAVRGRSGTVRVRALTPAGQVSVRAEMHLLAALEVAGLGAAPAVLSIEEDGYVRESAPSLTRGSGRRSAPIGAPATAERVALGRAREELDELVETLHERGWVVGAVAGQGLGVRADGTVVLSDLSGLRPAEEFTAQQEDRQWVDSVLQDQHRTLRRRVHEPPERAISAGTSPPVTHAPISPWSAGALPVRSGGAGSASAHVEPAQNEAAGDNINCNGNNTRDDAPVLPSPLPAPRVTGARVDQTRRTRTSQRGGGYLAMVAQILAERRTRRTTIVSAGAVLLAGSVFGTTTWLLVAPDVLNEAVADIPTTVDSEPHGDTAAPEIDDAWALASELAGARHAYITGLATEPVAVPDSSASVKDDEVRTAYAGVTVQGGGPVVHAATVLEGPTAEGAAVLRVESSMDEHEVVETDGSVRTVPAAAPEVIELELHWDGTQWRIGSTRSAQPVQSTDDG